MLKKKPSLRCIFCEGCMKYIMMLNGKVVYVCIGDLMRAFDSVLRIALDGQ